MRVVVDTVHTDLGLAVAGVPKVKIAFGGCAERPPSRRRVTVATAPAPMAPIDRVQTADERVTRRRPRRTPTPRPDRSIYDESPPATAHNAARP